MKCLFIFSKVDQIISLIRCDYNLTAECFWQFDSLLLQQQSTPPFKRFSGRTKLTKVPVP